MLKVECCCTICLHDLLDQVDWRIVDGLEMSQPRPSIMVRVVPSLRLLQEPSAGLHLLRKHQVRLQRLDLSWVCLFTVHPHLQVFVRAQVFERSIPLSVLGRLPAHNREILAAKSCHTAHLLHAGCLELGDLVRGRVFRRLIVGRAVCGGRRGGAAGDSRKET
jgi:hypothetical protein